MWPFRFRFSPARAGNRYREHAGRPGRGSAPRVRGTEEAVAPCTRWPSVQPRACGERSASRCRRSRRTVQPRACGERLGNSLALYLRRGSSPRVRGTRAALIEAPLASVHPRACGEPVYRRGSLRSPVHPRACGEHGSRQRRTADRVGSSPRVRGTRYRSPATTAARFIPARAGNRRRSALSLRLASGSSPRVRGTRAREQPEHAVLGSAPRVRGTADGDLGARAAAVHGPRATPQ